MFNLILVFLILLVFIMIMVFFDYLDFKREIEENKKYENIIFEWDFDKKSIKEKKKDKKKEKNAV